MFEYSSNGLRAKHVFRQLCGSIDDTDATLLRLIREGLCAPVKGRNRVTANRKNARHCRDGMHAHRILRGEEGTNCVPPSTLAAAMTERKERHRVPRSTMYPDCWFGNILLTIADL